MEALFIYRSAINTVRLHTQTPPETPMLDRLPFLRAWLPALALGLTAATPAAAQEIGRAHV